MRSPLERLVGPEAAARIAAAREADHYHDACGVFGVHGHAEAAHLTYLGLYALQHRGQESAGIATSNGKEHFVHRAMGLVGDVFHEKILRQLPGRHAIGHVRYSTTGESSLRNAQPFCATTDGGPLAIAHNGNLVNAGAIWQDAPVVVDRHFVSSRKPDDLPEFCRAIIEAMSRVAVG